jgi:hypothetical protein
MRVKTCLDISPLKIQESFSWNFMGCGWMLAGESPEIINCLQLKLLQQPFRTKVTKRLENGKNSNHCQSY